MNIDPWGDCEVDKLLTDEHPIDCKFQFNAMGLSWLDPRLMAQGMSDFVEGSHCILPFWLAYALTVDEISTMSLPDIYGKHLWDLLARGSIHLKTRDKSAYYFELGTKLAYLTNDVSLAQNLIKASTTRLLSIAETGHCNHAEELSVSEKTLLNACEEISEGFNEWKNGASFVIRRKIFW